MNSPQWVGLENFKRLLQDSSIPQIAWNVIRLPLFLVPAHVCCSLLLAYGVYRIGNKYLKHIYELFAILKDLQMIAPAFLLNYLLLTT